MLGNRAVATSLARLRAPPCPVPPTGAATTASGTRWNPSTCSRAPSCLRGVCNTPRHSSPWPGPPPPAAAAAAAASATSASARAVWTRHSPGPAASSRQRGYSSVAAAVEDNVSHDDDDDVGPMQEYDARVDSGVLRNDEHQRDIIQSLQHLHDELLHYSPPPIQRPTIDSLKPKESFFSSLFGSKASPGRAPLAPIPSNLPRGLYLYGDVGSGKTMLMDLFYDTLPSSIRYKTRIHFHNFMQDVHRRSHKLKLEHGVDVDTVPFVAADIAAQGNVLCFDEFQCTDVADAMILRRLLEALMSHGVVLVTTSNRHPDDLYKNGIQRESFVPAINLLKRRLHIINIDSTTDYRKIARPSSGVYHTPLDAHAASHAEKWFRFLGDPDEPEPHPEVQRVWGRKIYVPRVSGRCAWFTFNELIGQPTSAADYLELMRSYDAFIVTDVPGMTHKQRDLARRFITFVDAVYERHAKLVLTTEKALTELFVSRQEIADSLGNNKDKADGDNDDRDSITDHFMSHMLEDLDHHAAELKKSNLFTGEEEAFAFGRALSRLSEMGSQQWVERGMGLEQHGGKTEKDNWAKVRSRQMEDSM